MTNTERGIPGRLSDMMLEPNQEATIDMKPASEKYLLGLHESEYRRYLPEYLERQVADLMRLYKEYNPLLHKMYKHKDVDFDIHEKFYKSFLVDRNRRSQQIDTQEYEEIARFGESQLPMDTYEVLCMDGRVKLIHTNGFSAEISSSTRTAGGLFDGFKENDEGQLELNPESQFAKLLIKQLRKDRTKSIAEVLDSHWTCAKRIGEEAATGNINTQDAGLYRDVQVKQQMVEAIRSFLGSRREFKDRNVALIQTTFNPVTGFMYMGLETEAALTYAEDIAVNRASSENKDLIDAIKYTEFDKEIIKNLVADGKIISTGQLISDPVIKEALERHQFDIDWRNKYVYSAKNFWKNIAELKEELLPILMEKVLAIYPHLVEDPNAIQLEAEERAMLLLTNMYNTYLHNDKHDEMKYLEMDDEKYEEEEHYPYGIHNEEGVKVSEGGHPPYDITMFVVTPGDPESVETAAEIVRTNRRRGRIKNDDVFGYYKNDKDAFAKSPVPVVVQEIVRESGRVSILKEEWDTLRNADWSDMPADWDTMDRENFDSYIAEKGIDSHIIVEHIHELREKMVALYTHPRLGPHARQLFKTFLPGLCNQKREFQAIIPFVKVGRAMKVRSGNGAAKAA